MGNASIDVICIKNADLGESERSPVTTPSKNEGILCIYFSPYKTCVQLLESANTLLRGYYAECGIGMFNFRFTVQ